MVYLIYVIVCLLFNFYTVLSSPSSLSSSWTIFDTTSSSSTMTVSCPLFNMTFMKNDGGIVSIIDNNGFILSQGNTGEALWCIVGPNNDQLCSINTNEKFSYQFFPTNNTLLFTYTAIPSISGSLQTNIYFVWYENQPYVDTIFELVNSPQNENSINYNTLLWPNNLIFNDTYLDSMYVPHMPGMKILSNFFNTTNSYGFNYPSVGFWGGVFHWEYALMNKSLAIYDLSGPDIILPFGWQVIPIIDNKNNDTWFFYINNAINITYNCNPITNRSSPSFSSSSSCSVGIDGIIARRFLINNGNPYSSMQQYVQDNNMVQNIAPTSSQISNLTPFVTNSVPYPFLLDKLSSGLANQWFQSPMLKMDAMVIGIPFHQYSTDIYPLLPVPSVLHYVAYMVGGHDHSYPDFLPPDSRFNATSCDFANLIALGNQLGHITMPYTNPSWWCTNSPTVESISNLSTIAALNSTLGIWYEIYDQAKNDGIAVTPYAPAVQNRIAQFMHQFSMNVSANTEDKLMYTLQTDGTCNESSVVLPCTFIFEDQLGARYPHSDRSNYEQSLGALGYAQGWMDHIAEWSSVGLHSEQGVDRQARHILGYYGSIMSGVPGGAYGNINSEYYQVVPLVSSVLRSNVAIFQHDLEGGNHAICPEYLSWNAAMGYQLSLDIGQILLPQYFNISWLYTVSIFQKIVLSRYTHYRLSSFTGTIENITMDNSLSKPKDINNDNITSLSIFSRNNQPLLESYYSDTYQVYRNGNINNLINITITYPMKDSTTLSLISSILSYGLNIYGIETLDVIGGIYSDIYNNAVLAIGQHVIIEDRTCNNSVVSSTTLIMCIYHPTGIDTNITIVPTVSLQNNTYLYVTILDRFNTIIENNIQLPLNSDGTVTVYWQTNHTTSTPNQISTAYVYALYA